MDAPYYDREADVAYFPVHTSDDVISVPVGDWLIDRASVLPDLRALAAQLRARAS